MLKIILLSISSQIYPDAMVECSPHQQTLVVSFLDGGFLKWWYPQWWYPTTMVFPTKNWGYHHLRKHPERETRTASSCHPIIVWPFDPGMPHPSCLGFLKKNTTKVSGGLSRKMAVTAVFLVVFFWSFWSYNHKGLWLLLLLLLLMLMRILSYNTTKGLFCCVLFVFCEFFEDAYPFLHSFIV